MTLQWKALKKYPVKRKQNLILTQDHPLKSSVVTERLPRKLSRSHTTQESIEIPQLGDKTKEILDPLTELALQDLDPLSRMQKENVEEKVQAFDEPDYLTIDLWNSKKTLILNKYTTANKISIVSSYLHEGDKIFVKNSNILVDKVQSRLEQLDWSEETSQRKMDLTQSEYISKIDVLNKELVSAWNSEQRVKAVKIAIQCAKLLADTDVMSFYPSKFVLVTEILDIFGNFVYDRLKHLAETKPGSNKVTILPDNFTPNMISELAKETCLNWFHKIASIRELIPRLYVELAIIRSYNFISSTEGSEALVRITNMINGIGDPLVATYARCYLCKIGQTLCQSEMDNSYVLKNLQCIIDTYPHFFNSKMMTAIKKEELSDLKYLDLFSPALDFIMEIIVTYFPDSVLENIFQQCTQKRRSSLILNTIISVFKPSFVANRTVEFLEMIGQCAEDGFPISSLLCSLGKALGKYPPPSEQRKPILRNIGKYSSTFSDLDEYMCYIEAWMPFITKNFKVREINAVLGDIISRVSGRKDCDDYINQLRSVIKIIVQDVDDFESLFTAENFLPFLDLFQQDHTRVEVCKLILCSCKNDVKISDAVVTSALSFLCTILHDSVDALTPEDELRQIGQIICNVIRKVNYGRDFEQQLDFYVEARSSFTNIDSVLIELVQRTNTLMVKTRDIMQGYHTRKTADFVRACAAYCFITIPSITSSKARLELYMLSAQVALFNQCLGQADACLRALLATIPEYQEEGIKDEYFLVTFIKKLLSILLVMPDNPDLGVLSPLRSLLNILQQYKWDPNGTSLISIYISVLDVLSIMVQDALPYHIDKVESNDTLYGSDEKFVHEANKISSILLAEILNGMNRMATCRKQSALKMDLFLRILNRCDLSEPPLQNLALNLWQQCSKQKHFDKKFMESIKLYYKSKRVKLNNDVMQKFVDALM